MAENLPITIIETNLKYKINYYNEYSKKLLGISMNDDLLDYFDLNDKDKIKKSMDVLHQKGIIEINQYELKKRSGDRIKALIKCNLVYKENNIEEIRLAIFELEPNYNIVLVPDKAFFDKYEISVREKENKKDH